MRFIQTPSPDALPPRWTAVSTGRRNNLDELGAHDLRAEYIKKHGTWTQLKAWLSQASENKCWYCEAKSTRATFDVDHFRPKLAITVDGIEIASHSGYYWLAYDYTNFRLSCQRCNRPEKNEKGILRGKASEFPIQDETQRCAHAGVALSAESPRFLDPCVQTDCSLLAHAIDGEVKPAIEDEKTWEYQRARYTIDRLGLNDWNTPETKKKSWRVLDDLIRLAGNQPDVLQRLQEHLATDHEYASFFRAAIGTHREKTWVEALL